MTTTSPTAAAAARRRPLGNRGNILIYVLMTMVVFGLIGVAMVSLFSTSVSSSATANETRRAFYLSESGLRYGMSELRQNGFSQLNINRLNTTVFNVPPSGSFDITVFGAWFKSPSTQNVVSGPLSVEVEKGKIPQDFFDRKLPALIPDLYLVLASNLDPLSTTQKPNAAEIAKVNGFSYTAGNFTSFIFDLVDSFMVNKDYEICMAIPPFADRTFTPSGDAAAFVDLRPTAVNIFPKSDGSFIFGGKIYYYKTAKDEGDHFRLNNISRSPHETGPLQPVSVQASTDYILLTPNNFLLTSKGTAGNVSYGGDLDNFVSISDHAYRFKDDLDKLTISDFRQNESSEPFIGGGSDAQGNYLQIGGSSGGMGAMWYNQSLALGGTSDYCGTGKCFFGNGARVFFTLEYAGSGDGLIFALLNGQLNQINSAGGDFQAPELLGYAGDSRTNNSGSFIDTTTRKGLRPPKIGLEFDTKRNWDSTFEEKPTNFCSGSDLKQNTRNDPDPASATKDFVQYVFWGNDAVNVPCRPASPFDTSYTYDDNRHNSAGSITQDWFKGLSGLINTSPVRVMSADGETIFIGTNDNEFNPTVGRLYAFDIDEYGYPKDGWSNPIFIGSSMTTPVLADGTIYFGAGTGLYAIDVANRSSPRLVRNTAGRVTKPVIGPDRTIYIAANVDPKFGYIYAIRPNGDLKSSWGLNPQAVISPVTAPYVTAPVMSADNSRVLVAARDGYIYAFLATSGSVDWQRQPGTNINASVGVGPDGKVYTGTNDKKVYALNGTTGATVWTSSFSAFEDYASSPVVGPNGTVYIGNYDNRLYAINPSDGRLDWSYNAEGNVQTTPSVDSNNTVYFGCDNRSTDGRRYVFAVYSDGIEKWRYEIPAADVRGTPLVTGDGTVYTGGFGSSVFYAINQFALPKSLKSKYITNDSGAVGGVPLVNSGSISTIDWLNGGGRPWAVRMEVYRSTAPNVTEPVNYYRYVLRTWVRECEDASCSKALGTLYENTRVAYSPSLRPPQMEQVINLDYNASVVNFDRFLFGFTSQTAAGDSQTATLRNLKLSFVRPTDATITCDSQWPEGTTCP
jgi:outer membrane protein assembly factor BamB